MSQIPDLTQHTLSVLNSQPALSSHVFVCAPIVCAICGWNMLPQFRDGLIVVEHGSGFTNSDCPNRHKTFRVPVSLECEEVKQ
jgi:hypothetical protein